ncbi:MAG: hypothetical protein Q8940_17695 [Bacteroidota bacterium]|nr:hypothetical protein [Bacteroidota bacterium]
MSKNKKIKRTTKRSNRNKKTVVKKNIIGQESKKSFEKGYNKEYCDLVIQLGRVGYNFEEIAYEIGINKSTLYNWKKIYPEFKYAMEMAKLANAHWWWQLARDHVTKKFNFGVFKFVMVNNHNYRDTSDKDEKEEEKHVIILPEIKEINEAIVIEDGETESKGDMDSTTFTDEGANI